MVWQPRWDLLVQNNQTDMVYTAVLPKPASGWLGFYIQFEFESIEQSTLTVNTEVNVVPETYPYPDCQGKACLGILV